MALERRKGGENIVDDNELCIILRDVDDTRLFESLIQFHLLPVESVFEKLGLRTTTITKRDRSYCILWEFDNQASPEIALLLLDKNIVQPSEGISFQSSQIIHWGLVFPERYESLITYEHI